jgi:hypothetical protein
MIYSRPDTPDLCKGHGSLRNQPYCTKIRDKFKFRANRVERANQIQAAVVVALSRKHLRFIILALSVRTSR